MAKKTKPTDKTKPLYIVADDLTINGAKFKIPAITADCLTIGKWEPILPDEFAEGIHSIAATCPYCSSPMAVPVTVVMDDDVDEVAVVWFTRGIDDPTWHPALLAWRNRLLDKLRYYKHIE